MLKKVETLDGFIYNEIERVKDFREWYIKQHYLNPLEFPMEIPADNASVWDEMLADFNIPSLNESEK
ncbi:hypothetical protein H5185_20060 [Shewanella sp. SG44-6]|jgi:hypothetical protein|uniref:hypothetical protein n=1 Tax=Shewanella sp. SG44-6 TaxID=2760959 RepID=UPI0016038A90|nr:hypothetical protein [Shewanella sp. SG44-6]MBB1391685.1 hypothetical protein [Shewanella sp. SG44-6]